MSDQESPRGSDGADAKGTTRSALTSPDETVDQDEGKLQQAIESESSMASAKTTTRMEESVETADQSQEENRDVSQKEQCDESDSRTALVVSRTSMRDTVALFKDEKESADQNQPQEQSSDESDCSISSTQEAALKEDLKDLNVKIDMVRMPGRYAPDGFDSISISTGWSFLLLSLVCFSFGVFLGSLVLASPSPTLSTSPRPPSPLFLAEPRQSICQQICLNSNGSCHVTDKSSLRDWLFEAEVGLQGVNELTHTASSQLNAHAASVITRQDGRNLSRTVITCQASLQSLCHVSTNLQMFVQRLAIGLDHLDQSTKRNRLRRNNEQLDKIHNLVVLVRNAPMDQLHRIINASRSCTRELVQKTSNMTESHLHFAVSADVALQKFSELTNSSAKELHAALLALNHQANATAHFVGDAWRDLKVTRDDVDVLLALWS